MRILVINGPNLNMLGYRDKNIYGTETYEELIGKIKAFCEEQSVTAEFFQSNHEGAIIDALQRAFFEGVDGIVINPGAYSHYSIAIRDAIEILKCPVYEVHLSDIHNREDFRDKTVTGEVCTGVISGMLTDGYIEAVKKIIAR